MQDFKSIITEVKKHTVLYVLSIIAVITLSIAFYLKIADEIHLVAKEIGAALAI